MKKVTTLFLAILLISCTIRKNEINKPFDEKSKHESVENFTIENGENIAANMISPPEHRRKNTQPYYEGKLKIITTPDEEIVTGLDSNRDGKYDLYFFLQTTKNYSINEEIQNEQILYGQSCFIINDTNREFIKLFTLKLGNKKVASILENLPVEIKHRLNGNFVEGFGVGTEGDSKHGYGKIFNYE